jgi:carboxyl-terminal processing protease
VKTVSRTLVYIGLLLLSLVAPDASRAAPTADQATEANITRLTASILARSQFAHHPLDKELSAKFLDRYLDALDERRSMFLQSDVKEFTAAQPSLVRAIVENGDTKLAQQVWKRYLERLQQRNQYAHELLAKPNFTFDTQESYEMDRSNAPRPADMAAAKALWLQRVRAEYLDGKLDDQKPDQIPTKMLKRYDQQLDTMKSLRTDEITTIYLNALTSVYDPHSEYLGREQMQSLEMSMNLSLSGIGASLESNEGYCTVREVLPGGPASRSPLKPGDRIVAVAQANAPPVDITNMPLGRAVQLIRGPKGSKVTLTILPASAAIGASTVDMSLVRDEIKLEDQQAKATVVDLHDDSGALRLGLLDVPSFYAPMGKHGSAAAAPSVSQDVRRLLAKLQAEKVKGIVLDLRQNGGGSLEEAVALTGLFIPKGPVVQTRGMSGDVDVESDRDAAEVYSGPLIVLISRMSASASEILAGALQDYGRAIIVGDSSTFGKGTVQSVLPLSSIMRDNGLDFSFEPGALKVTIRKFYRPSGASTQLKGVASDIVIPSNTDVREISEAAQKNPLPWDTMKPAEFERENRVKAYLQALRDHSTKRIGASSAFAAIKESLAEVRTRLDTKRISLNEAERRQELAGEEGRQHALDNWWKARDKSAPPSREIRLKDATVSEAESPAPFAAPDSVRLNRMSKGPDGQPALASLANAAAGDVVLDEAMQILADYVRLIGAKAGAKPTPA